MDSKQAFRWLHVCIYSKINESTIFKDENSFGFQVSFSHLARCCSICHTNCILAPKVPHHPYGVPMSWSSCNIKPFVL